MIILDILFACKTFGGNANLKLRLASDHLYDIILEIRQRPP